MNKQEFRKEVTKNNSIFFKKEKFTLTGESYLNVFGIDESKINKDKIDWETTKITIKDFIEIIKKRILYIPEFQRPFETKDEDKERLLKTILKGHMVTDIIFGDLISTLKIEQKNKNIKNVKKIKSELDKSHFYAILDGQHRTNIITTIASIIDINENISLYFKSEEEINSFLNTNISIKIIYNCTYNDMGDIFTEINSGDPVDKTEKLWGKNTKINNFIRESANNEKYKSLFPPKGKKKPERLIYNTILYNYMVCSYYDGLHEYSQQNYYTTLDFLNIEDINLKDLNYLTKLHNTWFDYLEKIDKSKRKTFTIQTNLFFILHILQRNELPIDEDFVLELLHSLKNSRSFIYDRYEKITDIITNYSI